MFTENDHYFMEIALQEAEAALSRGDYPIGAVLTINDTLLGKHGNTLFSDKRTVAHAEHSLISQHSAYLRKLVREQPTAQLSLYTTLEPCLMCLGISVMHRISKIVIACPDPHGGAMSIDPKQLGAIYQKWWPDYEVGLLKEASCELILSFLKNDKLTSWAELLTTFQQLKATWQNEETQL